MPPEAILSVRWGLETFTPPGRGRANDKGRTVTQDAARRGLRPVAAVRQARLPLRPRPAARPVLLPLLAGGRQAAEGVCPPRRAGAGAGRVPGPPTGAE